MSHLLFQQVVFSVFAAITVFSALMVVTLNNPVRCVLFLVVAFISSAGMWIMAYAEFLALILVLVYVGAVMTLFLFVVMMINVDVESMKRRFWRYLPFGFIVLAVFIGISVWAFAINAFFAAFYPLPDPRHSGYQIGLLHGFTPLLLAWAFWKIQGARFFILYQFILFILMIIASLIMAGIGGLVSETNAGLFQRLQILFWIPWFTYTCNWLIRYKSEKITSVS